MHMDDIGYIYMFNIILENAEPILMKFLEIVQQYNFFKFHQNRFIIIVEADYESL